MSDHFQGKDEDHEASLQAKNARSLWLQANPDMEKVEQMYREAIGSFLPKAGQKRNREEEEPLECWKRLAVEQLCMILCQSGRSDEAKPYLQRLGYTCRLASCLLDYPDPTDANCKTDSSIACQIWDDFLSHKELQHLRDVFLDPQADYWTSHNYQVEPPSPYFSYVIPLQKQDNTISVNSKFGCLGSILSGLHQHLIKQFPKLSSATAVELWAHNRPHPTGHQFHFDSDNEGQGRMIKNPIMTAILYLSESSEGGPSIVTNQSLVSKHLASKAVMSTATRAGRMVAFSGNLLHGVIPGKGTHAGHRRVTLMLAFWRRIRVRPGEKPGAARPFPFESTEDHDNDKWNQRLVRPGEDVKERCPVAQEPIPMDRVYETLDGEPWTKSMGFPEYDQVFQGF